MPWQPVVQQKRDVYCDCGAKMRLVVITDGLGILYVRFKCRRCNLISRPRTDEVQFVKVQV